MCKAKNEDNVTKICINGNAIRAVCKIKNRKRKDKTSQDIIEVKIGEEKKEMKTIYRKKGLFFFFLGILGLFKYFTHGKI